jgi:hypothetical protein
MGIYNEHEGACMINNVIFSSTTDPMYMDFIVPTVRMWKTLLPEVNVIVGIVTPNPEAIEDLVVPDAEVVIYPSMPGIPDQNFAKVLRTILATEASGYSLISDVDMFPLNEKYFRENSEYVTPDNLVFYTQELDGEDVGKFPICYMLASRVTWKKLINPEESHLMDLFMSWTFDGKMEDIRKLPFSDESLYRRIFKDTDVEKKKLTRHHQERRLCRSNWDFDMGKLRSGFYIDSHLPRPLSETIGMIEPILDYYGIN